MKSEKSSSRESKTTGRFATAEKAAQAKNAGLVAILKKMNPKVITTAVKAQQVK